LYLSSLALNWLIVLPKKTLTERLYVKAFHFNISRERGINFIDPVVGGLQTNQNALQSNAFFHLNSFAQA
jgi:hypothetical protein